MRKENPVSYGMEYLILVLPYVLVYLIGKELQKTNAAMDTDAQGGLPDVEDLCDSVRLSLTP